MRKAFGKEQVALRLRLVGLHQFVKIGTLKRQAHFKRNREGFLNSLDAALGRQEAPRAARDALAGRGE